MSILHVVTAAAPAPAVRRGDATVRRDRTLAERCLTVALVRAGAPTAFRRDADGIPRLAAGWYGSWTHTRGLVAAVVARARVGIDVEWLGRTPTAALRSSAEARELELLPGADAPWRLRLWTTKEAVLKELRAGLGGLSRCRLAAAPHPGEDATEAEPAPARVFPIHFDGERRDVLQFDVGAHSLALSSKIAAALGRLDLVRIGAGANERAPMGVAT